MAKEIFKDPEAGLDDFESRLDPRRSGIVTLMSSDGLFLGTQRITIFPDGVSSPRPINYGEVTPYKKYIDRCQVWIEGYRTQVISAFPAQYSMEGLTIYLTMGRFIFTPDGFYVE